MEIDWNAIIWFVIWAAVTIAGFWLIAYIAIATFAARQFKKMSNDMDEWPRTPSSRFRR
ncbi:hypothetical protein [Leifsonia sp. Root4]|uniref:hypothetical protein n=1 Tax=Leifsonia sp. Root4 TaxID=1736525 RepID=UPI000AC36D86|nr:hypothetical protein [Leifsonia sp. Root4]